MKTTIRDSLSELIWKRTKRRPMILPIIMDIDA
jgi:ribonuclease J